MKQAGLALIIKDGLILSISRRDNKKIFGIVGGKFDPSTDKDTKDTAIRETYEETGVVIKDCQLFFERVDVDFIARCYYVTAWEGKPYNSEEGEVEWLTASELTSKMAAFPEYNTAMLEAFREKYPNMFITE